MRCMFSSEETDTYEHVIPAWLQRRMKLMEQNVVLPNGTELKYKHLKVPAAKEHNQNFGKIEENISRDQFDLAELYLWALKIHIGFIYRDSSLRANIRDPNSPFLLDIGNFQSEIQLFQLLYNSWIKGGSTNPVPFGSVYVVDSLTPVNNFDFMHCLITGTIGIDIGNKFILVFLWDQCDSLKLKSSILNEWETYHTAKVKGMKGNANYEAFCYLSHHVWACEGAYWMYRQRRAFNLMSVNNIVALNPPLTRLPARKMIEKEYRMIAKSFGLNIMKLNGEFGNIFSQIN